MIILRISSEQSGRTARVARHSCSEEEDSLIGEEFSRIESQQLHQIGLRHLKTPDEESSQGNGRLAEVAHPGLPRDLDTFTSHSKMVKLNVGGNHFSTSLETLTRDPGIFLILKFTATV